MSGDGILEVSMAARVLSTVLLIAIVIGEKMDTTELILATPAEYFPTLLVVGLVVGLLTAFPRMLYDFSEKKKEQARLGEKMGLGMNYLSGSLVTLVFVVLATALSGGLYYEVVGSTGDLMGFAAIGIVAGILVGIGGDKLVQMVIETFRNNGKAKEALTKPKQ